MIGARAVLPKKSVLSKIKRVEKLLKDTVVEVQEEVLREFELTTDTWINPVKFISEVQETDNHFEITVWTDDANYHLVNFGSSAHTITPLNRRKLRFQLGSRAKTVPGTLGSFSTIGSSPSSSVFTAKVRHPGFEPRRFDLLIRERYEPILRQRIRDAIREALG